MRRSVVLSVGLAALAGCSSLPWVDHGEAPSACPLVFEPGTRLEWAGRHDPEAIGLLIHVDEPGEADLYVGLANANQRPEGRRVVCAVYDDSTIITAPVPEGWQPP